MSRVADALKRAGEHVPESSALFQPEQNVAEVESVDATAASRERPPSPQKPGRRPKVPDASPLVQCNPALTGRLVVMPDMPPGAVEQYRRLAATLHHAQTERGVKVIMVSSAVPGEGKTLTAANLALTLSESYGRQVLLIDADLRRPAIHNVFQLPNILGLSDGLKATVEQKLSVVQVSDRLAVLPAGRPDPDPMSGLTSDRMRRLVEEAATMFDWVIIDTPPVGLLSDANLLGGMVDGALLVIASGVTRFQLIQRAVKALGHDRIIGVVLNRVDQSFAAPHNTYYDYYGYGEAPRKGRG